MQRHTLGRAIRLALVAGALGSTLTAAPAFAQDGETTELDRIQVTGSRIRQVEIETAQPVLTITREDIEKQGFQSVADILQNISAAGSPAISRAQPLSSGENVGGSFIDLRNIGTTRTLVLVNGKRLGISTSGLQDISLIPTVMIERIDVLKDSASSIYGSDAIGGVINIITRSNFEGAQASVYYGEYSEGDGEIQKYDFITGAAGERGSVTTAIEYAKEDEVMSGDRPFSAFPRSDRHPFLGWTTVSQWGVLVQTAAQGGNRVFDRNATDPTDYANFLPLNGTAPDGDVSNTNLQTHLRTPLQRKSIFVDGNYELADWVRLRGNAMFSEREANRQVAGYPYQSASFATPMSIDSYYNPLGNWHNETGARGVSFWRRTWEVPRTEEPVTTTYRVSGALEGSFEMGDRYFDWDVNALHNNNKVVQANYGNLNLDAVLRAVGPSFFNTATGRVECGTPTAPIAFGSGPGACVPWNPFVPFGTTGNGGLTGNQPLQDYLFQELHSTGETQTTIYNANISGLLFTLPAGDLTFAAGAEYRKEEGEFVPDALAVTGRSTTLAAGPTRGEYTVDEFYAELNIPVFTGFDINVASRYSDYDTFGDTTNSKLGLQWRPLDQVLIRGTWAEGFRAPTIANLYGGGSQTFSFFTDPCDPVFGAAASNATVAARCAQDIANYAAFRQLGQGFVPVTTANAQTPLAFFSGSNPNLQPEESKSKTLGVVWSPEFVDNLNMSLDWWSIRIEETIVADTPTQMLNDCYIDNIASRCLNFTRDPVTGIVNNLAFGSRNAGYVDIEGFDFDLGYRFDTDWGAFSVNWQNTYTSKYEQKTTNDAAVLPQQLNSFAGFFRLRSNFNVGWTFGDFAVNYGARYYSKMKESCLSATAFPDECSDPDYVAGNPAQTRPLNVLGSNTFHDLQLRWKAPWDATFSIGANNITDHYGPPLYTQPAANVSYYGGFDIGRFWYVRYQQQF